MIKIFSFFKGSESIKEIELGGIPKKDPTWIRCISPDKELLKRLSKISKIPLEDLCDYLEGDERPFLYKGKYLQIIFSMPSISQEGELETIPIYIYHSDNIIITIETRPSRTFDILQNSTQKGKSKYLFRRFPSAFIFASLDKINDEFLLNVDRISSNLDVFEKKPGSLTEKNMERIYQSSIALSSFNQSLLANIEVLNSLRKCYYKSFTAKDREKFHELYYDGLQILDTEKVQREVITNLFNLQSSLTSYKLNEFMKRLTSIAFIVMVPTLIASIYGMNFEKIPLSHHPYGFHITVVGMFALLFLLYAIFKKLDLV